MFMEILKTIGWILSWPFVAIICLIQFYSCSIAGKRYSKDFSCATDEERYDKVKKFLKFFFYWKNIKIELVGKEKLDNKIMLFIANHKSNIDPIVLLKLSLDYEIPYLSFLSKIELKKSMFANFASLIDTIYIDRNNLRSIVQTLNEEISMISDKKHSLCIFPEGTRIKSENEFGEFKPGALEVAYQTYLTIQPIVIYNSLGVFDKGLQNKKMKKTIYISIMNKYLPQDYINTDKVLFMNKLQSLMFEEYNKIKLKVEKNESISK